MAPAIPLVAAGAGLAASAGIASTALGGAFTVGLLNAGIGFSAGGAIAFTSSLAGFVVSTAVNAVGSRALSSNPKAADFTSAAQGRSIMVRSVLETHKIVYGQAKVSGPEVVVGTTSGGRGGVNGYFHFLVLLAAHEVDSIGTVYLNDIPVTLNADGFVTSGPYWNTAAPSTKTISSSVRASEVVTVTTSSSHGFTVGDLVNLTGQSDSSMDGDYIIQSAPTGTTFTVLSGGPNSSATGGTATDNTNNSDTGGYVRIKKHTGSIGQVADADLIAEVDGWDAACRLQGIAYLYVRLEANTSIFGSSIPNVSAIVNGKQVYDPRSGLTAYSTNAALCIRDYMISDYGINCPADEVNDTYFSAAANACDESVALTTGGTQSRYTINGVLDTATNRGDNLNALIAAIAGGMTYVQGQFRLYAGVYDSPVGDLDPSMLAGDVDIQVRPGLQSLFNAVKGTYVDPALRYQATDFPPIENPTYTDQDGGEQVFRDIQLPLTNHHEAAQRIAKVILEQGRQGITMQLVMNHRVILYAVWDTVTYTDPALGWDHKVFRIKKFSTDGIGPVVMSLQEESSASYDWNSGEATVNDPAPDTNLASPFIVNAVQGVSFSSRAVTTTGGDTVYNLVLNWTAMTDTFVLHGGRIEIQYKLHSEADWRPSFFVNGDVTTADILSSSVGDAYDLRVRAVNTVGRPSGWTQLDNAIIGSSGGVGATNDWGSVADSVGPTNDWAGVADVVGTTDDWGSVV